MVVPYYGPPYKAFEMDQITRTRGGIPAEYQSSLPNLNTFQSNSGTMTDDDNETTIDGTGSALLYWQHSTADSQPLQMSYNC